MTCELAVVVVNYGSHELLERNLVHLDLSASGITVVVVDNFTTTEEQSLILALGRAHSWRVILNEGNLGFGAAVNQGVAIGSEFGAQNYLLLNPDVEISLSQIRGLLDASGGEQMTAISPVIVNPAGRRWFEAGQLDPRDGAVTTSVAADMSTRTAWLSGACLLVGRQLWDRSGGFNPDYFLYWEDVDFSFRCRRAGGRLQVAADIEVVHHVGGTQGSGKSSAYLYYNCRNRLLFAATWLPLTAQRRWARRSLAVSYSVWRRGGRAAMLSPRALWAVTWGTVAGIWHVTARRSRRGHRLPLGSQP